MRKERKVRKSVRKSVKAVKSGKSSSRLGTALLGFIQGAGRSSGHRRPKDLSSRHPEWPSNRPLNVPVSLSRSLFPVPCFSFPGFLFLSLFLLSWFPVPVSVSLFPFPVSCSLYPVSFPCFLFPVPCSCLPVPVSVSCSCFPVPVSCFPVPFLFTAGFRLFLTVLRFPDAFTLF